MEDFLNNELIGEYDDFLKEEFSFDSLTAEQCEALIDSLENDTFVIAGPGAGKTRLLIKRIEYLVKELDIEPSSLMVVTFTSKAAEELKERLSNSIRETDEITIGTYHSICYKILRDFGYEVGLSDFSILTPAMTKRNAIKVMTELGIEATKENVKEYLKKISLLKNDLISSRKYRERMLKKYNNKSDKIYKNTELKFIQFYTEYQKYNLDSEKLDFDDLVLYTSLLLEQNGEATEYVKNKYRYILCDETQDSNIGNIQLLNHFARSAECNLFLVADLDQSIYGFRKARPDYFIKLKNEGKLKIKILKENHRSTKVIVKASNSLIAKNKERIKRECVSKKDEGELITWFHSDDEEKEAETICNEIFDRVARGDNFSDIKIIYRLKSQMKTLENELIKNNIPYKIHGSVAFCDKKEVRDTLAFLRCYCNPQDDASFKRALKTLDNVGDVSVEKLLQLQKEHKSSLIALKKFNTTRALTKKSIDLFISVLSLAEDKPYGMIKIIVDYYIEKTKAKEDEDTEKNEERIKLFNELLKISYDRENSKCVIKEFIGNVDLMNSRDISNEDSVELMTIHSSKGLESKTVFIIGLNEGEFPSYRNTKNKKKLEEERRCMFVACTRAKEKLYLSSYECKDGYSRFIDEIPEKYIEER